MNTSIVINNAATVGHIYEAFGRADIGYIMEQVAPDCQWTAAGAGLLPHGGTYTGTAVVNFFKGLDEELIFNAFNPLSINNLGENEVVAFGNMDCTSKLTGKKAVSDWVMHWKFNDEGKVIFYQDYHDTAAAYVANQA